MKTAITILDHLHFDAPTGEQKKALDVMSGFVHESNTEDFFILRGAAGTGKTSITTALIGYLNSCETNYHILAPTGRSARILGRKSKTTSNTIHSLIYNVSTSPETAEVVFSLKPNVIRDFTVFIIDEASMIPSLAVNDNDSLFKSKNSLLCDLISFVKNGNKLNKLMFLGDDNQLPPIREMESRALSINYLSTKFKLKGSLSELTEVKRQEDGSYILKNAHEIRKGIANNLLKIDLQGFGRKSLSQAALDYVTIYKDSGHESITSIGATHNMNKMFNKIIRERLYGHTPKLIEQNELLIVSQTWQRNGYQLYSGDHVSASKIEIGSVEKVADLHFVPIELKSKRLDGKVDIISDYLLLESIMNPKGLSIDQEKNLRFTRFTKNKVYRETCNAADDRYVGAIRATFGYSITCNKAQGGEWDNVFINAFFFPSLRYQYTAITRARKELVFY